MFRLSALPHLNINRHTPHPYRNRLSPHNTYFPLFHIAHIFHLFKIIAFHFLFSLSSSLLSHHLPLLHLLLTLATCPIFTSPFKFACRAISLLSFASICFFRFSLKVTAFTPYMHLKFAWYLVLKCFYFPFTILSCNIYFLLIFLHFGLKIWGLKFRKTLEKIRKVANYG